MVVINILLVSTNFGFCDSEEGHPDRMDPWWAVLGSPAGDLCSKVSGSTILTSGNFENQLEEGQSLFEGLDPWKLVSGQASGDLCSNNLFSSVEGTKAVPLIPMILAQGAGSGPNVGPQRQF